MNSTDFTTELFRKVDDAITDAPRHSRGHPRRRRSRYYRHPRVVKGVSPRAFYPWLRDNYGCLFPQQLPERTRGFRRLHTQQYWTGRFLAAPTLMGIADSYGIELRHPIRDGRRAAQIGRKGISNHRWISGDKLRPKRSSTMGQCADCRRVQWNVRMTVETVFAMMRAKWDFKAQRHRAWEGFEAHLAYAMAGFNILAQWNWPEPNAQGRVHLSIAQSTRRH